MPQYVDLPAPVANGEQELVVTVKAAAIKHLDKSRAAGQHYSITDDPGPARVIGMDGVGLLEDGTRVFALGVNGMVAEKAVIEKSRMVPLPEGIDDAIAAALPNAVAGAAMALRFRAAMKEGETVLINGATGFTGRIAVQIARHYGAKKIIATGRNEQSLQDLRALGADEIVPVKEDSPAFTAQIRTLHQHTPIDIVLDYLWGPTAEQMLEALKGDGGFTPATRYVSVGAVTGEKIRLSAAILRSANLQLCGSGLGSWAKTEVQQLFAEILPEMFRLAAAGKLKVETITVPLADVPAWWDKQVPAGKRLVITL